MSRPLSITLRNYRAFGDVGAKLPLTEEFLGLIGLNNSAKTSLLRSLYEMRPLFESLSSLTPGNSQLPNLFGPGPAGLPARPNLLAGERVTPVNNPAASPQIEVELGEAEDGTAELNPRLLTIHLDASDPARGRISITSASGVKFERIAGPSAVQTNFPRADGTEMSEAVLQGTMPDGQQVMVRWEPARVALALLADSMYLGAFRNAVNTGGGSYYDLAIGSAFVATFANYQSGDMPVANESVSAMCEELRTIFGFTSLQIAPTPDRERLSFVIDGRSYRGSELGAGITQFVLVAANVLVRQPSFLLIDEPELNLHASLQLRFLTLLAQYTKHGVLFSTHSLGLARSGADRILVASRQDDGAARVDDYHAAPTLASVLGELGHGGLHEPAYRAVLLVEGVHDVRTFQQLLSHYGVRGEVVIVPLGGDDLASAGKDAELAELCRLSDSVYAVVDSERTAPSDPPAARRNKFKDTCDRLKISCSILDRRSIENYFTEPAARSVYHGGTEPMFGPFDQPAPGWGWSKARNWRVAQIMKRDDLSGTDLDSFLGELASNVLRA